MRGAASETKHIYSIWVCAGIVNDTIFSVPMHTLFIPHRIELIQLIWLYQPTNTVTVDAKPEKTPYFPRFVPHKWRQANEWEQVGGPKCLVLDACLFCSNKRIHKHNGLHLCTSYWINGDNCGSQCPSRSWSRSNMNMVLILLRKCFDESRHFHDQLITNQLQGVIGSQCFQNY